MKYPRVNWENGMKINEVHFIAMENALRSNNAHLASTQITPYNYGLIPIEEGNNYGLDLYFKIDQFQNIVLSLNSCRAITPNGWLVDISPNQQQREEFRYPVQTIQQQIEKQQLELYIYLVVLPFEREKFGSPQAATSDKIPFVRTKFRIEIGDVKHQDTSSHIVDRLLIGRITAKNKFPELDEQYIPPHISMVASPILKSKIQYWTDQLHIIYQYGISSLKHVNEMINKDITTVVWDGDSSEESVAERCRGFTHSILECLPQLIPLFETILPYQAPVYTFIHLKQLALSIKLHVEQLENTGQNLLVKYLNFILPEQKSLAPVKRMISTPYQHHDIREMVQTIDEFIGMIGQLFKLFPSKDFKIASSSNDPDISIFEDDTRISSTSTKKHK